MSTRTAAPKSPYKGLRPFEATAVDAQLFFGRERERELIAANLTAARLTVLYGESGVGKSSVLRAGVVHPLRQQAREGAGFAVALFASWSDEDPIEGIADAVREAVADVLGHDPGPAAGTLAERLRAWADIVAGEIYLVLDQVDEYFLYHGTAGGPVLDELPVLVTEPGLPVNVLLSIREDSLARLDVFKARIPSLFGNYLRLERLARESARAAIVGPLEQWSRLAGEEAITIEPALVDTILDEVAVGKIEGNGSAPRWQSRTVEPPYLQIVVERIWDAEREAGSRVLRLATLEQLGGARRVVAEHLDRALDALGPAELDTAAAMFTHLVTPSGAKIAHEVGDLAAYAGVDEADARRVASRLVEGRILRPVEGADGDGSRVEIFHDVLASAVASWGRDREAANALEAERAEARGRHRRLLAVVVAALVALAAMTVVAVYAVTQQREADDQRAIAADEAGVARAREHAAEALLVLPTNPIGALRSATRAASVAPSARTVDVLRTALVQSRQRSILGDGRSPVLAGAFSPDGRLIATGDAIGRVIVAPRLGPPVFRARHRGAVNAVAFPGGGRLVTASEDGTAVVWDLRGRRRLHTLRHGPPVLAAAVSADGRVLATGADDQQIRIWDLDSGESRQVIPFPSAVERVSFSSDGRRVLAVGGGYARLFDAVSGGLVSSFEREGEVTAAALSSDGQFVATGHAGKHAVVRLWHAATGRLVTAFVGHSGGITDVAFSPAGPLLVTASSDATARVYNIAVRDARQFIGTLIGHTNGLTSARFTPDGLRIVTASADKTAAVWKREGNNLTTLVGHLDTVNGAEMSADGKFVLTWSKDGTARVWDPEPDPVMKPVARFPAGARLAALGADGNVVASVAADGRARVSRAGQKGVAIGRRGDASVVALSPDGRRVAVCGDRSCTISSADGGTGQPVRLGQRVLAAAFSGDGRRLVAAGAGGRARVWDVADGGTVRTLDFPGRTFTAAALNGDGNEVALGDGSGEITLWGKDTGAPEHGLQGHANDVTALAFSRDGRLLVSGSRDHDARIWRVRDGKQRYLLRRHFVLIRDVEFSPDGRWVVTVGETRVGLWSTATGTLVLLLQGRKAAFLAATFGPDSRVVRAAGVDGTMREYRCQVCGRIDELLPLAQRRIVGAARAG